MAPNYNMQSIKTNLDQSMRQIQQLMANGASSGTSSANTYMNSIWNLTQEGIQAFEGNDAQKANAISNVVKNLLGMISNIGTHEAQKAKTEDTKDSNKIKNLDKKAKETASETEQQVKAIIDNIASDTESISKAISKINDLGVGGGSELSDAKAKLDEQLQIIEDNKKIINDGVSSPEAKEKALANLLDASSAINGLVDSINKIQKQIEEQNGIVEKAANSVQEQMNDAANVVKTGAENIQTSMQNASQQVATEGSKATIGNGNIATGQAATAEGEAARSNVFTGTTVASQLLRVGADQTKAGQTRIKGAATNLENLSKTIGGMNSSMQNFGDYINNLSSVGNGVSELVGQYGTALDPIITTIGSWSKVADANEQFEQAIADYQKKMNAATKPEMGLNSSQNTTYTPLVDWNDNGNVKDTNNNNVFDFDTKLFQVPFDKQ